MKTKVIAIFIGVATLHLLLIAGISMSGGCRNTKVLGNRPYIMDPAPEPVIPQPETEIVIEEKEVVTTTPPVAGKPTEQVIQQPATQPEFPPFEPIKSSTLKHTVGKGESFWTIAHKYGVSMKELASYNQMPLKESLKQGTILSIPPGGKLRTGQVPPTQGKRTIIKTTTKKTTIIKKRTIPTDGEYVVQKGDSLWKIAKMYGIKTKDLAAANNLDLRKTLRVGQKLKIPAGAKKTVQRNAALPLELSGRKPETKVEDDVSEFPTMDEGREDKSKAKIDTEAVGQQQPKEEPKTDDIEQLKETIQDETINEKMIINDIKADKDKKIDDEVEDLLNKKQETPPAPEQGGTAPLDIKAPYGQHEVTEGETVEIIAKQYGFEVKDILALNPGLTAKGKIKEGTVVKIP